IFLLTFDERGPSSFHLRCHSNGTVVSLSDRIRLSMKTVDITYRYGPQDAQASGRPADSAAALRRLNDGNTRQWSGILPTGSIPAPLGIRPAVSCGPNLA